MLSYLSSYKWLSCFWKECVLHKHPLKTHKVGFTHNQPDRQLPVFSHLSVLSPLPLSSPLHPSLSLCLVEFRVSGVRVADFLTICSWLPIIFSHPFLSLASRAQSESFVPMRSCCHRPVRQKQTCNSHSHYRWVCMEPYLDTVQVV